MTLLDLTAIGSTAPTTSTPVIPLADMVADRGVCALVDGRAVAVFLLSGSDELVAIDNVDPFTGASVLSRGLVGSVEIDGSWVAYVASPLRKQRFDLHTGACLDDPDVTLDVFAVVVDDGMIGVRSAVPVSHMGSSWGNASETRA